MIKTGIFGGSFNPIHNGHISLARQLKEKAGLDEVWLMVSPQNPMKRQADLLSDEARLQMARLALEHETGIIACDYEMHLPKPSYTWLTLQALSRDYPDRQFVLMIGGDNWSIFHRWYHADDILQNYQVVVYPRRDEQPVEKSLPAGVTIVEAELLDVSSTEIRQRIREGRSIRKLVPPSVAAFIKQEGYYV
jgi:nicotinate-nucleotide adenylyltransferase